MFRAAFILLLILDLNTAFAAHRTDHDVVPVMPDGKVFSGASTGAAKSDTVFAYGGPGTLDGKFETAGGLPDRQGWIGVDLTVNADNAWHVDPFLAAGLDPVTPGNVAWWCGEMFASCGAGDPDEGYGNGYSEAIEWSASVADPGLPTTVRVTAVLNHDTEPGYDYLRLQVEDASGWVTVWETSGTALAVALDETFTVATADYMGTGSDEVHLRWQVTSDGAWSDADCLYASSGAAQVDLIEVSFDQGGGPVSMGIETCEPGDPLLWTPVEEIGAGDFSKVWPQLADLDPCVGNDTPQFAFIDDGVVVPGTGGSLGVTWTYGPGSFVVNTTGGLLGPGHHVQNQIWSPPIALLPGDRPGHQLAFDIWPHLPLTGHIYWTWAVDYSADGVAWDGWQDRSFVYYGTDRFRRYEQVIGDFVPPDAAYARISLGIYDAGWIWGFLDPDPTPAPYFDNVAYKVYAMEGPQLSARAVDMAQDGFAQVLDPADPAAATVRFDSAHLVGSPTPAPGDSIIFRTDNSMLGAVLTGPPTFHYHLFRNPVFDAWRTSGLPDTGVVVADTVFTMTGLPVPDQWCVDMPDAGFLFPGDVMHYYITAESTTPGFAGVSIMPADTTGYGSGTGFGVYDEVFTFRALPSVVDVVTMEHPDKLLWIDDQDDDVIEAWRGAIDRLAVIGSPVFEGDVFLANHSEGGGLGLHAVPASVAGYTAVIYDGGKEEGDRLVDGVTEISTVDIDLLTSWIATGNRGLAVLGDNVVSDLVYHSPAGAAFASDVLGVSLTGIDLGSLIGGQLYPTASTVNVPPFGAWHLVWSVDGRCPDLNGFDAIEPAGDGVLAVEWLDASGTPGQYPYAALVYKPGADWRGRLTYPFGMASVSSPDDPVQERAYVLLSLCAHFDGLVPTSLDDGDDELPAAVFEVSNHPNPFNPHTTVSFSVPTPGRVTVELFDVRGAKVRTLLDEARPAGQGSVAWKGRDDAGRSLGSGVYFARVRTDEGSVITRMTMLR